LRYTNIHFAMKKTVFITGASSGFGKESVHLFHEKGWNVVATMRSPEKELDLIGLSGVLVTKLDVTDKATIASATALALSTFGQIDVLINNAGYGALGALEAASDEEIRRQLEVNLFGLIAVTQAVLPGMRAHRSGVIVNVSSMGGRIAFPFSTLYHATKFAVEGLTESLQYELNPLGIRTKIIEPGGYKTEFAGRSMSPFGAGDFADYRQPWDHFTGKLAQWTFSENIRQVADAIYQAATDGSEQLRYPVGQDAMQMLQLRQQMDDAAFKNMMAGQTGMA
jgi:NAD(P)-dependent dehydrogenase (short-subunit alcohol dehydrogenase family)